MEIKKLIGFCTSRHCADKTKTTISSVGVQRPNNKNRFYCDDCGYVLMLLEERNTDSYRRAGALKGPRSKEEQNERI